jgi:hypothetical protein
MPVMSDFLQGESGRTIISLVAIVTVCGGPFLVGAWALWLKHRKEERYDDMKREMLAMGMSADDIVRVLNAGTHSHDTTPPASPPPPKDRTG